MVQHGGYETVPSSAEEDQHSDEEMPPQMTARSEMSCQDTAREIGTHRSITCQQALRYGFLGLVLTWCIVAFASYLFRSDSRKTTMRYTGIQTTAGRGNGVIDSVEFNELLKSQTRSLLAEAKAKKANEEHINTAVDKVHRFFVNHLTKVQKQKLQRNPLNATFWSDLKTLCTVLKDPRVRDMGRSVLYEIRRNIFAGPAEIGKKVTSKLQEGRFKDLANEVLPYRVRQTLGKWDEEASGANAWHAMLDPTGELFPRLRQNHSTILTAGHENGSTMSLQIGGRRLENLPTSKSSKSAPKHTTLLRLEHPGDFAEGIVATVAISASVIVLNIDLLSSLEFPKWVHGLLFVSAAGLGGISCSFGLTLWCDIFLGGLGLLALEASLKAGVVNYATGAGAEMTYEPNADMTYE